ncbi:MAG: extracellular solute-binding protein [Alphaproteobacteria bacterium]|nr:extracellular solute-binding protein [Alphaproteobacteria bacterium]
MSTAVIRRAAAAIVALAALIGAPVAAQSIADLAKREGKLQIYTLTTIELQQTLVDGFKRRHPEIAVDFFRGDGGQIAQRFETENAAARNEADIVQTVDFRFFQWRGKGLIQPYRSPALAGYPAAIHGPDGEWSTFALAVVTYAYNTKLVKPEDLPRTWADLADPKWTGKVGLQDPMQRGGARGWVMQVWSELGEDRGRAYLTGIAGLKPRYGQYLQVREMLLAGEIVLQIAAQPNFTEPLKAKGAPVDWGVLDPAYVSGISVGIAARAPRPNAAKLWVDYLLGAEAQALLAAHNEIPALPAARTDAYARLNAVKLVPFDLARDESQFAEKIRSVFGPR